MTSSICAFQKRVREFYTAHGRHNLPWRTTHDPYKILVSEIMLQQTQVERVIPKYKVFLKAFPTIQKLHKASLCDVLKLWSGLGYNRRARMLHSAAQQAVRDYNGALPKTIDELERLSGVGPYTARAVMTFAYNEPVVMIETNIRSVFIHEFFNDKDNIEDAELFPLIEKTLDTKNPREWYAALMDYGSFLKKTMQNPSRRSKHHTKQSTFKGSLREARGKIVRLLFAGAQTERHLIQKTQCTAMRVQEALEGLATDGLVRKTGSRWEIVT